MPIYEYRCEDCGHIFEEWQKDFETHDFPCPSCGGKSERVMSNTSFILKGSGWYVTDYGKGSSTCGAANGASGQDDSGGGDSGNGASGNGDSKSGGDSSASDKACGSAASSGSTASSSVSAGSASST